MASPNTLKQRPKPSRASWLTRGNGTYNIGRNAMKRERSELESRYTRKALRELRTHLKREQFKKQRGL